VVVHAKIDPAVLEALVSVMCTEREIADYFQVSTDSIQRFVKRTWGMTYTAFYEEKSARAKVSLRRKQFQCAMQSNTALLIFLGKNWLGQTDKVEVDAHARTIPAGN
jgi:IS30 family transposase